MIHDENAYLDFSPASDSLLIDMFGYASKVCNFCLLSVISFVHTSVNEAKPWVGYFFIFLTLLAWLVFFGWLGHAVVSCLLCFSALACLGLLGFVYWSGCWFRAFGCWVLLVAGRRGAFRFAGS